MVDLAILAIFKNEESFLPEWIDHYFNSGVDHIFLLNDGSIDNSVDIIQNHVNKQHITLKNISSEDVGYHKHGRQEYLYNKYYHSDILTTTRWIGIFDLDEFCYSPELRNIKNILNQYNNTNIQQIIVDWYWFGSNGYLDQPVSIIDSFTKRSSQLSKIVCKEKNLQKFGVFSEWCCKSFAKTKHIKKLRHHFNTFYHKPSQTEVIIRHNIPNLSLNLSDHSMMYINHYIGSKNYFFQNKVARGSCNAFKQLSDNKSKLYDYINLNEVEDTKLKNQKKTYA